MDLGTEDELIEQIFQITRKERQFIQQTLKQHGLNIMQAQALNFIAQHPGAIQKKLSVYLGKSEATTTNIIKILEQRQLVVRRLASNNERQKQLYLLPDGQVLVQSVHKIFIDLEQRVSAPLTATEKNTLLSLLHRISEDAAF
ncbi:MarR family winged helix-turn-helix transcriptional regulator [Lacticaseibacillus songhuajiangensis]|jgi:DNA-binding MarR family transcriptional regulator|uniref:MarR family winged helix-turn-helix transcriptional regulator n=1 Tax=Lacticaseibacillus songhuajiangensis TaxID=1296539 RepID=UPI000F777471|nr:MarR family transcriptional regulator [Lacticaseibacillus songhuajiangensis]